MRELASAFFFLGFSVFVLWGSLLLGLGTLQKPGSGFMSFCAGLILFFLSLALFREGRGIRESRKALPARRALIAMASVIVYSLVLETLGFIVSTFFLVAILFHLGEPRRWWVLLGISALVTLLVYLIFGVLLQVYFPRGILAS